MWKSLYTHKTPCPVKKVEVEFEFSGQNYTDGEMIHLSFFEDEIGTTFKSKLINLEAKMIHECSHINYTAFKSIKSKTDSKKYSKFFHTIFNIVEDGRIERIMSESILGAGKKLRFLNIFLFGKALKEEVDESPFNRLMSNMLYYSKLGLYQKDYNDSYDDFKIFKEDIMPRVDKIISSNVNTSFFYILDELYDILLPFYENEADEDMKSLEKMLEELGEATDDHNQNQQDGDNYNGSGQFEQARFNQKETSKSEGSDDSKSNEGEDEENSGNIKSEENIEEKNSKMIDNIEKEVEAIEDSIEAIEMPERKEITDEVEEALKEAGKANAEKELKNFQVTTKDHGDSHYVSEVQDPKILNNTELQMRAKVLKKTFSDILKNKEKFSLTAQNKGAINPGLLYSSSYNPNIFTIPGAKQDRSYAVSILIDGSGSMSGKKIEDATNAAVVLEEALKEYTSLRITKFTTSSQYVTTMIIKDFCDKKSVNYSYGSDYKAYSSNYDYVNLVYESGILAVRPETDKIMFILSDGYPCGSNTLNKMKIAVKTVKDKGITLIPIFFAENEKELSNMTDTFKEMYGNNVIASKVEDLTKHLSKVMKKFLEK